MKKSMKKSKSIKKLIITADTNDADYVTSENDCGPEEEALVRKVVAVMKAKFPGWGHNWPTTEYEDDDPKSLYADELTQEEIDSFNELVPSGEYGIHTVTSIRIVEIVSDEDLMK